MEPDRRLARAGAALHDERTLGLGRDQPVLVGLDRGDDVAHPHVATALELLEQEVGDARALDRAAVERLVGDVGEAPALGAEAPPLLDAVRLLRRRCVERPRRRCLPVDDQRLVLVVVHPASADVEWARRSVEREPPEDEARARRPRTCACRRFAHASMFSAAHSVAIASCVRATRRPHAVELVVGVVDVCLLGCELRVRHTVRLVMKLGLNLGYAPPGTNPADLFPLVQEAERLGFDSVWVAEAWGTDAVSVARLARARRRSGSSSARRSCRSPGARRRTRR